MATEIIELDGSRSGQVDTKSPGMTMLYVVKGTTDELEVISLVRSTAPANLFGFLYRGFNYAKAGYDVWTVSVEYTTPQVSQNQPPPPEPGSARISYTTKGKTEKIDTAIDQTSKHGADFVDTVDMHHAINFDGKSVNGVDRVVPTLSFVIEYTIPGASLTPTYIGLVYDLTGKINAAAWKGFGIQEVLFTGFDGAVDFGKDTTLTFSFEAEPTQTSHSIDGSDTYDKKGWDYVWVTTEFTIDAGSPTSKIRQVNYAQVYETGDFTLLGIPITTLIA